MFQVNHFAVMLIIFQYSLRENVSAEEGEQITIDTRKSSKTTTMDNVNTGILGRPLHLGMMYDQRTDRVLLGANLFDESQPPPNCVVRVEPVNEVQEEFTTNSTLESKMKIIDLGGSVGVGLAAGPVEVDVEGAFGIVRDDKKLSKDSRLIASKRVKTISKSLDIQCLKFLAKTALFDKVKKYATHVVSSVTYGATINFVFDSKVDSKNDTTKISGYLSGKLTLQNTFTVGEASLNITMTKEAIDLERNTKVKFHGDVFLPVNPITVEHAILLLQTISRNMEPSPEMAGETGGGFRKRRRTRVKRQMPGGMGDMEGETMKPKAVPVLATLTPLSALDSSVAKMGREMEKQAIDKALSVFDAMSQITMFGNDVLQLACEHGFFPAKKIVFEVKDFVFVYRTTLQSTMASQITRIRSGKVESNSLIATIYTPYITSPFKSSTLGYFVQELYKHCEIMSRPTNFLQKAKKPILPAREAVVLVKALVSFQYLLVYKYQEMTSDQPFMDDLNKHVNNITNQQPHGKETIYSPYRRHYFNRSRSALAMRLVTFIDINEKSQKIGSLYFTKDIEWEKADHPEPSIYLYENARLVDRDYQIPSKVVSITCFHREHDSLEIGWERPLHGAGNVLTYEVVYYVILPKMNKTKSRIIGTVNTNDNQTKIENLNPNTEVHVNITPISIAGRCETTDTLSKCLTRPSSPPSTPVLKAAGPSSLLVAWFAPEIISPAATFLHYLLEYQQADEMESQPMNHIVPANVLKRVLRANVSYLIPKVSYKFRVTAVFRGDTSIPGKWSAPFSTGLLCHIGWNISDDGAHCYFFTYRKTFTKTWELASADCKTRGSSGAHPGLVTLWSDQEVYVVEELARLHGQGSDFVPFWLGLRYENNSWLWVSDEFGNTFGTNAHSGRQLAEGMMAHWAYPTKFENPREKKCAYVGMDLQWRIDWCDERATTKHYICKKNIEKPKLCSN